MNEGRPTDLGTLKSDSNGMSKAQGINQNGEIVGWADTDSGKPHAFLYSNGIMREISELHSDANAITNDGLITGWLRTDANANAQAFLCSGGKTQLLESLGSDLSCEGMDLNEHGIVCGWTHTKPGDATHAVIWKQGKLIDIGTLGGDKSSAHGINIENEVVGWSRTRKDDDRETHAFLWIGDHMIDMNPTGWIHSVANDINDNGWIVGRGTNANGERRGFVLKRVGRVNESSLDAITSELVRGLPDSPMHEKNRNLRRELSAVISTSFGTLESIEAAKLLSKVPAPVDRLQPSGIPPYELRVAARGSAKNIPSELVASYGGSKLNHWRGVYALDVSKTGNSSPQQVETMRSSCGTPRRMNSFGLLMITRI